MLTAAVQTDQSPEQQRRAIRSAEAIGDVGEARKKNQWDMVEKTTGIDMIGLDIKLHGLKWLDKYPDAKVFLEEAEVTPAEAVALHEKWTRDMFRKMGRDEKGKLISTEGTKFTSLSGEPLSVGF